MPALKPWPHGWVPLKEIDMDETGKLLADRETTHGSFSDNGRNAQTLKSVIRNSKGWAAATDRQREALDMIASKLSRIMSGQPEYYGHWADIAGYATLAGNKILQGESERGIPETKTPSMVLDEYEKVANSGLRFTGDF